MVRVSRRAVVMYSDMRFSISATRIHARPWKARSPLLAAPKGLKCAPLGLDLLWPFSAVPVGRGQTKEQAALLYPEQGAAALALLAAGHLPWLGQC